MEEQTKQEEQIKLEEIVTRNYSRIVDEDAIEPVINFIDANPTITSCVTITIPSEDFSKRFTKVANHVAERGTYNTEERLQRLTTYNVEGSNLIIPPNGTTSFSTSQLIRGGHMLAYGANAQEMLSRIETVDDKLKPMLKSYELRTQAEAVLRTTDPEYAAQLCGFIGNSARDLARKTGRKSWAASGVMYYDRFLGHFSSSRNNVPYFQVKQEREDLARKYGL